MIAMRRTCLDAEEMQQVLQGELSREEFDSAISHLDRCETCRTAIETIDERSRDDKDLSLNVEGEPDSLQNETACQVALQNLIQRQPPPSTRAAAASPPFQTLGPYRLLELLGSGGMGAVYLAEHQRLKRTCAIKLLPPDRVSQAGWLERFDREMTAIAALEHPHIVRATDAGHEEGWHYLVMEYLDGMDVGRIASRLEQLPVPDACEIVRQAALGLSHIHDAGLVHRDMKPSNVMLTRGGTIKLLDLGLVLHGDDPLSMDERLTTVGHVMGTMPYMAPEQLADSRDVRPQSDIYSLGATLFRLITGRPPHRCGKGLAAQVLAITHQDAPAIDQLRDDVDPQVVSLVAALLSRNPDDRPSSAAEVAQRLQPLCKGNRLKPLLRQAEKRPDRDSTLSTGLLATGLAVAGKPVRRSGWGISHWLWGAAAAALLLLAGWVIKVQTDKGEVIFYGDETAVSLAIKQGDKIVRQLTLDNAEPNRIQLHKGDYELEIQGGGNLLKLSRNQITVGRGSLSEIDVIQNTDPTSRMIGTAGASTAGTSTAGGNPAGANAPPSSLAAGTSSTNGLASGIGIAVVPSEPQNRPGQDFTSPAPTESNALAGSSDLAASAPATPERDTSEDLSTSVDDDSNRDVTGGGFGGGFAPAGMGGFGSPLDLVQRDGKSLREWLEVVKQESDPEKLGSAAFASIALLEDLSKHGFSDGKEKELVVATILHRARELGGLDRKLPPIPGVGAQTISPSEHFMWYLSDLFGQPDLATWYESCIDELVDGNAKSRAAIIACLHRQQHQPAFAMGANYGGMGGMGGYQAMPTYSSGFDTLGTLARFTFSRLLRCCIGLGTENAWLDLPEADRSRAASMAREVAVLIPRQVGMAPEQMPELVRLLRSVPKEQRSDEENRIVDVAGYIEQETNSGRSQPAPLGSAESADPAESDLQNADTPKTEPSNADRPEPAPDMGSEFRPMETPLVNPLTETPDTSPAASVASAPAAGATPAEPNPDLPRRFLYQGKDLADWLEVLSLERDGTSLIQAMKAVETLSRESPPETRREAARQTLLLTRRLGGLISGGDENPSHQFMNDFPTIFAKYFPDPGIDLIINETKEDHFRSKVGSIRALQDYLSGSAILMEGGEMKLLEEWFDSVRDDEQKAAQVRDLSKRLLAFAEECRNGDPAVRPMNYWNGISGSAGTVALQLTVLLGDDPLENPKLRDYIDETIGTYVHNMVANGNARPSYTNYSTLSPEITAPAILRAAQNPDETSQETWKLLAGNLLLPFASRLDDLNRRAFEVIAEQAPDVLLEEIHHSLNAPNGYVSAWPMMGLAAPFYAQNFVPVDEAKQRLEHFRAMLSAPGYPSQPTLLKHLDQAEKILNERAAEETKPDTALREETFDDASSK